MNKKYYAWKDGVQSEGKQEWVELTPNEFIDICNNNRALELKERRFFYQLPGFGEDDCYLYLECAFEQYKASRSEKQRRTRQRREREEMVSNGRWYATVSLDETIEDGFGDICTLQEVIPDLNSSFDNSIAIDIALHSAMGTLSDEERNLINGLFFGSEGEVSISELSRNMGVPRRTVGSRKKKIFEKLKKSFASF